MGRPSLEGEGSKARDHIDHEIQEELLSEKPTQVYPLSDTEEYLQRQQLLHDKEARLVKIGQEQETDVATRYAARWEIAEANEALREASFYERVRKEVEEAALQEQDPAMKKELLERAKLYYDKASECLELKATKEKRAQELLRT